MSSILGSSVIFWEVWQNKKGAARPSPNCLTAHFSCCCNSCSLYNYSRCIVSHSLTDSIHFSAIVLVSHFPHMNSYTPVPVCPESSCFYTFSLLLFPFVGHCVRECFFTEVSRLLFYMIHYTFLFILILYASIPDTSYPVIPASFHLAR